MPATQLWSVRTGRDRLDSQTRTALISAAGIVFSRLGYARTTVADITERADVGIRERLLRRMTRFVERLIADGIAHPLVPPDMVATAASGMAIRFAPLVAAAPADRTRIMGHLTRLYLQTLGIGPEPAHEVTS